MLNSTNIRRGTGNTVRRDNPESRMQQALVNRVRNSRAIMPELKHFHSCPNSTQTSEAIAGRMKREGVERGAFDLFWDLARGGWHGLRIEMKAGENTLSEDQKAFAAFYARQGMLAVACFSEHDAWAVIEWYYSLPQTKPAARVPLPAPFSKMAAPTVHKHLSPETAEKRARTFAAKRAASFGAKPTETKATETKTTEAKPGGGNRPPSRYPVRG